MSQINTLVASAKNEIGSFRTIAHDGFQSKAFLYPFKGIFYFIVHPDLWRPVWLRLGPSILTGTIVTLLMFLFTYFPQVFLFGIFNGPLSLINTFFLVLSESAAISAAISKTAFLERGLRDAFDATLVERGSSDLVASNRKLTPGGNVFQVLVRHFKAPWSKFAPANVISYAILLPLNFIPVVGTPIFIYMQGKKYGPVPHKRYHQLKGRSPEEVEDINEELRGAYTAFGIPATILEHFSIFGIFFAFTNTVGAALWAHDLEYGIGPTQELQDVREKADDVKETVLAKIHGNPDLAANVNQAADKIGGDLKNQLDQSIAGQVAADLKAHGDALAKGVTAGLPHGHLE